MQHQRQSSTFAPEPRGEPAAPGREGLRRVVEAGARHGFGPEASAVMWHAVAAGYGRMAQFQHPEFGGPGQWMQGGMVMVGDMFDHTLKARVSSLCTELTELLAEQPDAIKDTHPAASIVSARGSWWPAELKGPASSGAQNDLRYAWFPSQRRLAIERGGRVEIYDTGDHVIGSVAQQQGDLHSLSFTSQHGTVDLARLKRVPLEGETPQGLSGDARPDAHAEPAAASSSTAQGRATDAAQILDAIDRMASLRDRGILSDPEFQAKKRELLSRL